MGVQGVLRDIVAAHKRGEMVGIYSICSAHPFVLEAGVRQALADGSPLLVESTANQVNQEGGYTGLTPAAFHAYLGALAGKLGLPPERLILGGDHLGPGPWRREGAETAMAKARALVRDCIQAGYTKLHLDASVWCAGDPPTWREGIASARTAGLAMTGAAGREGIASAHMTGLAMTAVVAERTADLCQAAEEAYRASSSGQPAPCYVMGAEVPPPGGAQGQDDRPAVTRVEEVRDTIDVTRQAFQRRGLDAAWDRVVAVVVQPGVEFSDSLVHGYDRPAAVQLSRSIEAYDHLVYEAHSTDYQPTYLLRALVEDHFAILKVGPALTFAFREAVFALALIEAEWLSGREGVEPSGIRQALDTAMLANPAHWRGYYTGPEPAVQLARRYSYSDRCRYYWPDPAVQRSLARLLGNLEAHPIPLTLLSQFLPIQYERVRSGALPNVPTDLIYDKIRSVLAGYAWACGYGNGSGAVRAMIVQQEG